MRGDDPLFWPCVALCGYFVVQRGGSAAAVVRPDVRSILSHLIASPVEGRPRPAAQEVSDGERGVRDRWTLPSWWTNDVTYVDLCDLPSSAFAAPLSGRSRIVAIVPTWLSEIMAADVSNMPDVSASFGSTRGPSATGNPSRKFACM